MCGIIGYVGSRECKPLLLHGLERLEYRGYDSAGIALLEDDGLDYVRAVGNLGNLKQAAAPNGSQSTTGLGHTRWATHGGVTEAERAPADRLRRRAARDRPERDRRELPRAQGRARGRRPRVQLRDRRRGRRAPHRAALRRRPGRGRARRLPASSRATSPSSSIHRDHPGQARRRAAPVARSWSASATARCSSPRRRRVPARDAHGAAIRGRRRRRDHARGRPLHRAVDGNAVEHDEIERRLGRRGRREGRLRDVHAQGDLRAAGGRRRDDRRPRPARPARARGPRADRRGAPRTCAAS